MSARCGFGASLNHLIVYLITKKTYKRVCMLSAYIQNTAV